MLPTRPGTTLSGRRLPRHTDEDGRVWVTCTCGTKIQMRPEDD